MATIDVLVDAKDYSRHLFTSDFCTAGHFFYRLYCDRQVFWVVVQSFPSQAPAIMLNLLTLNFSFKPAY